MQSIIEKLQKFKKAGIISLFLVLAFIAGNSTTKEPVSHAQVLSAKTQIVPSSTPLPVPTIVPVTIINNIIIPTQAPVLSTGSGSTVSPTPIYSPTITPAITQAPSISLTISPIPTITPTLIVSPSLSPTPTPVSQSVEIDIDYAGQHTTSTYTVAITSGETAWQAVQDAVGIANLHYTDYGGDLGIFITGFNGISTDANQYYDFQVNGTSSNVGVSSYVVNDHDVLKFVLTNF